MNLKKLIGIVFAAGLFIGVVQAQSANPDQSSALDGGRGLTQQILQKHTFREGLVWTGDKEPNDSENQVLFNVLNDLQTPRWTGELEQYLQKYPTSPWAASLHYDYASFCRRTGRTTKALAQFADAWALLKNDATPQGQRLGGAVLANWMDLLSSLGRSDELKTLMAAGDTWHFVNPRDRDKFQGAKNSYYLMQMHPEMAFRCGTFALKAVGGVLQPDNTSLASLVEVPSPTNGFNMAQLVDLAKQYGLNMVAVHQTPGTDLVVPSVVHWRQNHYAAILKKQDDEYLVSDPTFGNEKWLPATVINEEASGDFLIPATQATSGWAQLASATAKTIHGMGLPNNINDGKDKGCPPVGSCASCKGMPIWWVTEPYINLWMADEPLSYLTSRGEPFTLRLTYKQRDSRPELYGGWNNSWISSVTLTVPTPPVGGIALGNPNTTATVYLPDGGEVDFNMGQTYDSETRLSLQSESGGSIQVQINNGVQDASVNGIRLVHADGAQDIYEYFVNYGTIYGEPPTYTFLRTRHIDPDGDTTWFEFDTVADGSPDLLYVVDPDGRTNTLTYQTSLLPESATNMANDLLVAVSNAYGQSAHFKYDANGNLTNLVDAQGLSSRITWDANNNPTALITPYGTNTFVITNNSTVTTTNDLEGNFGGDDLIDRAVQVTDPVGANYLYMYRYDCSSASLVDMSPTFLSSDVPTNTPLGTLDTGTGSTNILAGVCYRNSFYWGPHQFLSLSTNNMNSFNTNDYLRGRMQHWLEDTNQMDLTGYISVQQDASPDGITSGLLTFYDYQGKLPGENFCAGTNALPSVIAWRLPGGETHFHYQQFDNFGNLTNDISTYTPSSGGWGTRTNQFIYASNTYTYTYGAWNGSNIFDTFSTSYTVSDLLIKVIGADGNQIWSYGGFDPVTWTNVFNAQGQTNGSLMTSSRVRPDYATNGLGQVAVNTFTSGGSPVTITEMYPSNSNVGTFLFMAFPGANKISSYTSVSGLTTTNIYATNGFLAETIDLQTGRTNSFGFTTDGLAGALTNELGLELAFTWDNLLRLTGVYYPDGTYNYILYSKLDPYVVYDRLGNHSTYVFDGDRHLTSVTRPNSAVTAFDWCGCGALTGILDALTHSTTLNYDNALNLTNVTFADTSSLNYQYDLAGRKTSVADGAGKTLQLARNNQGLVTAVSNSFGLVQKVVFDVMDRPAQVTDANGVMVTNTFDPLGQILTRTWPDGIGEGYGYTAQGLAFYTNRDGQVTRYGHDVARRLVAITNANLEVVQAVYNPANEITTLIDGLNHTNRWQYDQNGWLTNKVDALGRNAFQLTYNSDGWVINRWTPEKGNTGYAYDSVGNLTNISYPQSAISYTFDLMNELTGMTDLTGTTKFSHTSTGQLAGESNAWAQINYTFVQGLRTAMNVGSWSQSYSYDSAWRMTNIISPAGTFNYSFNFKPASPLVTGISLPNSANITNGYDALGRLQETALNNQWGQTLDGYSYQMDTLGLRTNILRNLGLTTSDVSVGYDKIAQVTSWFADEANGTPRQNEQLGFGFDAADNLHFRTNNLLVQTFSADAANELTNVSRSGTFTLSGATPAPATNITVNGNTTQTYGDFTFAGTNNTLVNGNNTFLIIAQNVYGVRVTNALTLNLPTSVTLASDNNGNLTNDGVRTFAFDSENQMTNVTIAGVSRSDFVYDGLNRRRIERDYSWNVSTWTKTNEIDFIDDNYLPIQERDTNHNVLVTYTRGLDMSGSLHGAGGIGGLLARTDANGSTFYHADGSGNITALMDGNENIVARYMYSPFGKLIRQSGVMASVNHIQFASMFAHPSGIDLSVFRFYMPDWGKFINQDPIQENGGINLYGYVGNDPVNYVDPYGLYGWADWGNDEYNAYSYVKSLFYNPDGMKPNDGYNGDRAGTGTVTPITDENGNDVTSSLVAQVGMMPLMAVIGGSEREGAEALTKVKICPVKNLTEKQLANLARFEGKIPANATDTKIFELPNGGKAFQSDSAAKNIPGSYAQYEKQVDADGNTLQYTKTTFGPNGEIIHVKDK